MEIEVAGCGTHAIPGGAGGFMDRPLSDAGTRPFWMGTRTNHTLRVLHRPTAGPAVAGRAVRRGAAVPDVGGAARSPAGATRARAAAAGVYAPEGFSLGRDAARERPTGTLARYVALDRRHPADPQ